MGLINLLHLYTPEEKVNSHRLYLIFESLLTKRPAEATFNPNAAGFAFGGMSSSSYETAEPTSNLKNYTSKEKADRLQEMKSEEAKVERVKLMGIVYRDSWIAD